MTAPQEARMTTLQEVAIRNAIMALQEARVRLAWFVDSYPHDVVDKKNFFVSTDEAIKDLRTALAQQELPQKERPDFMAGYDAGMTDAKRMAQQGEQQPVCAGCGIPAGDVHMSTCQSGKWPSRVSNCDTAAPAPQPAQGESLNLAREVLKLNALWNKSTVQAPEISDQLGICRVLSESEDDMELTDAQILALWEETYVQRGWTGIEFARAIERAHGIGVTP